MRFNAELLSTVYICGKHSIPLIILIFYSFLGGWIFLLLERPGVKESQSYIQNDSLSNVTENIWKMKYEMLLADLREIIQEKDDKELEENLFIKKIRAGVTRRSSEIVEEQQSENVMQKFVNVTQSYQVGSSLKKTSVKKRIKDLLQKYSKNTTASKELNLDLAIDNKLSMIDNRCENDTQNCWNIWTATLYAASLYTTIGYGNIVCKTISGRVATMIYSLFGIPLVLTILSDLGMLLFKAMKYIHVQIRFLFRWFDGYKLPNDISEISFTSAFLLLIIWMCGSAGIFLIWETEWNYFTSFYFFFITLTTIGLGDVTPEKPEYTLGAFVLVLFGLSVVSMFITIIQTKVEHLFQSLISNIDSEYQQKVADPTQSDMNDEYSGGMGLMKLWKQKPLKERILYKLMDKHKKEMLEQYWTKKSSTKNKLTQTELKPVRSIELQVDLESEETMIKNKNRKYIYNLYD